MRKPETRGLARAARDFERIAAGFAAAVGLFLCSLSSPASAGTVAVDIQLGDTLIGRAGPSDSVAARFMAVAGSQVSIQVRPEPGSDLEASVRLVDESGSEIDLGHRGARRQVPIVSRGGSRGGKRSQQRAVIPTTGMYTFEIESVSGSGKFEARTAGRFPRRYKLLGSVPGEEVVSFDVMPGAEIKVR